MFDKRRPPKPREDGHFQQANEAESGSLLAAHTFDFQGFDICVTADRRLVVYMSNEQFTW